MSYLNALASDGLSVGLRLYSSRLNRLKPDISLRPDETREAAGSPPAEKTAPVKPAGPAPQSAEERAAGRAEAESLLAAEGSLGLLRPGGEEERTDSPPAEGSGAEKTQKTPKNELTSEERLEVQKLSQRDREVRAHEQAHVAASGGLAGSPHYDYQTGPDGRRYAVGGEVSVRRSGSSNTEQSIAEAEAVKRGALAPAQPSSQDRSVAAAAEADLNRLRAEKRQEGTEDEAAGPNNANKKDGGTEDGVSVPAAGAKAEKDQTALNGAEPGRRAAGAYAAARFGGAPANRPLLAKV